MPHPPRSTASNSAPNLKLRREPEDDGSLQTYKFPSPRRAGPATALVAARVNRRPFNAPDERGPACAVTTDAEQTGCAGRIISSRDLVRDIESTLDRMQDRLNDFRREMDVVFRFPVPGEGGDDAPDRPRAA